MKHVNIHEAKSTLSALLMEVEEGGSVVICRNGKPVADLVGHRPSNRIAPHPVLSQIKVKYDPTEPAQEDEWPEDAR